MAAGTPELAALVAHIQALSGTAADLASLLTHLRHADTTLAATPPQALMAAVAALDPASHGLGVLFLAAAIAAQPNAPADAILHAAGAAFAAGDAAQLRMAPEKVASLGRRLRESLTDAGRPAESLPCLMTGARLLQLSPRHLTPLHADVAWAALMSPPNSRAAALEFLAGDVTDADALMTGLAAKDVLLWAYYGGTVLAAGGRVRRGTELLLAAVTAPAMSLSAIAVAAYKRWALLCLATGGAVPSLPKQTSTAVGRHVRAAAPEVAELAAAYAKPESGELTRVATLHEATFRREGNAGLVARVVASRHKRAVAAIAAVYSTRPLAAIAASVGLESAAAAESVIRAMVDAGDIDADVDAATGVVAFRDGRAPSSGLESESRLRAASADLGVVTGHLAAAEDAVACNRAYLAKVLARERQSRAPADEDDFAGGAAASLASLGKF